MTKNYLYVGPISGVTLKNGQEIMMFPNKEVTLPDDNGYVKKLVAQKFLQEVVKETVVQTKGKGKNEN